MKDTKITDSILYVGVDDKDLDLFESQYVVPNGVSYNSYVILDEKVTLMDTVDQRATKEWLENLDAVLEERLIILWFPIWNRIMQRMQKHCLTNFRI